MNHFTRAIHQLRTVFHAGNRLGDEVLNILRRHGAFLRQSAHFSRHHRKSTPLSSGARRFNGGIQRQNVGLEGDAVNDAGDIFDALRVGGDGVHGFDHLAGHGLPGTGVVYRILHQLTCLVDVLGIIGNRRAQLLHAGSRFRQGCGLLLGAGSQVDIAGGNLLRGVVNGMAGGSYLRDGIQQGQTHLLHRAHQQVDLIVRSGFLRDRFR